MLKKERKKLERKRKKKRGRSIKRNVKLWEVKKSEV
jgi:hypothetical protein